MQLRKLVFAKLPAAQRIVAVVVVLQTPQLDAADFSGNRLRQFAHQFDTADALEWRKPPVQMPEYRERGFRRRLGAGYQQHVGLRNCQPDRIRTWHDRRLGNRFMLEQDALQLERADAVVGGLEDVVR